MRAREGASAVNRIARPRAVRVLTGALLLALGLAGCGGLMKRTMRSYAIAPSGLDVWEDGLRRSFVQGAFDSAYARSVSEKGGGPGDRLLRALYAGAAAHYAGRYVESAQALERASQIADDRYTRSASKGALALVTNDRALSYVPGENERAMVHYYALLTYLKQDDAEGAAVEARRLGALLQRYDDDGRDPMDASTRAMLRYLSGVAFETAGYSEDAGVAYRNARLLLGEVRLRGDARLWPDSMARAEPDSTHGDVVVVVEQGFVAHRVDQSRYVRLGDGDSRLLASGGGEGDLDRIVARIVSSLTGEADGGLYADRPLPVITLLDRSRDDSASHGTLVNAKSPPAAPTYAGSATVDRAAAAELLRAAGASRSGIGRVPSASRARKEKDADSSRRARPRVAPVSSDPVAAPEAQEVERSSTSSSRAEDALLKLAWPAYRRPATGSTRLAVGTDADTTATPLSLRADLSDAVVADFKRDRAKLLSRLVLRAAARQALTQQASKKHSELGSIVSSIAGDVLERADTRSWHVLPGSVGIVRLRLPVGRHAIRLAPAGDASGAARMVGEVEVRAGGVAVLSTRIWPGEAWTPQAP